MSHDYTIQEIVDREIEKYKSSKAALRQALVYIAVGAGLYQWSGGEMEVPPMTGENTLPISCLRLLLIAIVHTWHRDVPELESITIDFLVGHTLDTLTDKLWEMGVRA